MSRSRDLEKQNEFVREQLKNNPAASSLLASGISRQQIEGKLKQIYNNPSYAKDPSKKDSYILQSKVEKAEQETGCELKRPGRR